MRGGWMKGRWTLSGCNLTCKKMTIEWWIDEG